MCLKLPLIKIKLLFVICVHDLWCLWKIKELLFEIDELVQPAAANTSNNLYTYKGLLSSHILENPQ